MRAHASGKGDQRITLGNQFSFSYVGSGGSNSTALVASTFTYQVISPTEFCFLVPLKLQPLSGGKEEPLKVWLQSYRHIKHCEPLALYL